MEWQEKGGHPEDAYLLCGHACSLSPWTSHTKHKFKDKVSENSKTPTTEH